jgi:hypothetical protein
LVSEGRDVGNSRAGHVIRIRRIREDPTDEYTKYILWSGPLSRLPDHFLPHAMTPNERIFAYMLISLVASLPTTC